MRTLVIVIIVLFPLQVCWAQVRNIYYDGRPLDVAVASGKITEVIFPDKIAKIVKGGGADSVLIEVLDYSVFVLPKNENPADIFVTSVKGESYPLNLVMGREHEAKVKISYAFDPARSSGDNRSDVMDLMKLLIQGRVPAGATVVESKEHRPIAQGQIELTLNTVFELPKLNGLVFTAHNMTNNAVIVPIQSLSYSRLLAISSEADSLNPANEEGNQTRIYMVVEK